MVNLLSRSFTDLDCTVKFQQGPDRYRGACLVMEYLLKTKRLPAALVEEMRKISTYEGRDLDKIIKDVAGRSLLPE